MSQEQRKQKIDAREIALAANMKSVSRKILVLSGKGGVGKSTVAVNLALALKERGKRVGLLDVDIHGPSVPTMLGLEGARPGGNDGWISPVEKDGLKVMSIGFMLPDADSPIIWRGPIKMGAIQQFLAEVDWGKLDYLIVDAPPGTGDEPLSVAQSLPDAEALVVTTPQRVSAVDVRKSITFCHKLEMKLIGVVENMNGIICPKCGERITLFPEGEARAMAEQMGVPLLGSLPMDPQISLCADQGVGALSQPDSPVAQAFMDLSKSIESNQQTTDSNEPQQKEKTNVKRIAIPVAQGKLCAHFGHCEVFHFVDLDEESKEIVESKQLTPPPHEPGVLPRWVAEQGANMVLAGGMGGRAIQLFNQAGVNVVTGCPSDEPEELVRRFANDILETGANVCGHDENHKCGGH